MSKKSVPITLPSGNHGQDEQFLQNVGKVANAQVEYGPTGQRPTNGLWIGRPYFDQTIDGQVIWNGSAWVGPSSGTSTSVGGVIEETGGSGGSVVNEYITQTINNIGLTPAQVMMYGVLRR